MKVMGTFIAGALLGAREPLLERGETWLETLLEPCCWNLWLKHFAGTNADVDFAFCFTLCLAFLAVPGCDVGNLA